VIQALRRWVEKLVRTRSDLVQVGYFGSYSRGDWGVGSDLDLIIVVDQSDKPFEIRANEFSTMELPVPTDLLVYTVEEWEAAIKVKKFFQMMEQEAVWVYSSKN
jgi:predicted nucleotidyltransferase